MLGSLTSEKAGGAGAGLVGGRRLGGRGSLCPAPASAVPASLSLRGRGGRREPSATAIEPGLPGSMGPPLCAARPAPRRARSLPCYQVTRLWVLRVGDAGGWHEGMGNSWVLQK